MDDLYNRYLRGVGDLLQAIQQTDDDYLTVLTLQGRLAQAIAEIRQYGPTDNARAEIARVTTELDRLCLEHLGKSFRKLCGVDELLEVGHSKIYHNLPQPDYGCFVGREQELARMHELLSPTNRHFLVVIDGVGGVGKSALALEVAHRYLRDAVSLLESERFDAIIWVSAKRDLLAGEGIVQRRQALRTLNGIYTTISITLEREDIIRARSEEQSELVRRALTRRRTLLIVDNLETVDDEAVLTFLRELPAPTKAIVTTRHRIDVAYAVRLGEMPWSDAKVLITQECEKKGVELTEAQAHKLFEGAGGVPLALVWSVAQIGFGHGVDTVLLRLGQSTSDIARFCFESAVELIRGTNAYRLLMALSLFATDASREALGVTAGLQDGIIARDQGLVDLERLSLVNKQGARFRLMPLTKSYVLTEVSSQSDLKHEMWLRLASYLEQWSQLKDKLIKGHSIEVYDEWRIEHPNIVAMIDSAFEQGEPNWFLQLILTASFFQFTLGYWEERTHYAKMGLEISQSEGNWNAYARLAHDLAYMAYAKGDLQEAARYSRDSQEVFRQLDDLWHLGSSLRLSGMIALAQNRLDDARRDLEEDLSIMQSINSSKGVVIALNALAELAMTVENYEEAELKLVEALRISEDIADYDSLSHVHRNAGKLAQKQGNLILAEQSLRRSLSLDDRMGRPPYRAQTLLCLASVLFDKGEPENARPLVAEAYEIVERVGMKAELDRAKELLQRDR